MQLGDLDQEFLKAVECCDARTIQLCLENGVDPTAIKVSNEYPLLHRCIFVGSPEPLRLLLTAGLAPDITDSDGDTPLFEVAERGYIELANLLINAGANINHKNHTLRTPLMIAAINDQAEMIDFLFARGALPHETDSNHLAAIDYAQELGNAQAVSALTRLGSTRA